MVLRHGTSSPRAGGRRTPRSGRSCSTRSARASPRPRPAFAVAEGLLDLDDTVLSLLPRVRRRHHRPAQPLDAGPARRRRWPAGTTRETSSGRWRADPAEPVRGFLLIPPDREPGTVFAYNQPCTYTLAAIIQRPTGHDADRVPAAAAVRPARHRRGRLAAATRPGASSASPACTPRTEDVARLGPALPAARSLGRAASCCPSEWVAEATRVAGRQPGRAEPRLAPGLRLPVLDVPARLPRRRRLRAVLRGAARAGRGGRHHRGDRGHAGHPRRGLGAPPASPASRRGPCPDGPRR